MTLRVAGGADNTVPPARTAFRTPVAPRLDHPTAMRMAATEYDRFLDLVRSLDSADWARATCCPGWDVRSMTGHVLGMARFSGSPREQFRQMWLARRAGGLFIDALTDLQVREAASLDTSELVAALQTAAPRSVRGRRRLPAPLRLVPLKDQPVDETGSKTETWRMGYLTDVILTRDVWMHRSDIAAAIARPMHLTVDHDALLVADAAQEWAARHGRACRLTLTGPAGGTWAWGNPGANDPSYECDVVEFCRTISGRQDGEGLLITRVPF
jgi:uncharacterized protein (TIGR03083 family)